MKMIDVERMNDVAIDETTLRTCEVFAEIATACFKQPWEAENFVGFIQKGCSHATLDVVLEGSNEEKTVGFAVFYMNKSEIGLVAFAVLPQFQNQGFGRQMLRAFIREAESRHLDIYTTALETDVVARKLFRSLGFEVVRTERGNHDGVEKNCFHLRYSCRYKTN